MSITQKNILRWISNRPLIHGSITSLIGNGIGRIGGLAATIIIAVQYGATHHMDVFYMLFAMVAFFLNLFQGALELSFIPIYSEIRSKSTSETKRFLGSMLLYLLLLTIPFVILIDLLVWYFGPFFLAGQNQDFIHLTVRLTWEMSPVIIGVAVSALFIALFNAERLFMAAGLMPFFPSFGIIIFALLLKEAWGVQALSIGFLFGTMLQIFVMFAYFQRKEFQLEWGRHHSYLSKVLKIASLQTFALFLASIMPVMDRVIVSFLLSEGNVTAIENATKLCQIPWSLATVGYINVFFSWWSRKGSEGDLVYVNTSFKKLFVLSCVVFIPISLLLFMGSLPIVKITFGYGKYDEAAIRATSDVFGYFCLGYWAFMLRSILIRFYSVQFSTPIIAKAAIWDFCVHFLILFLFIKKMGIATIGIATMIGYFFSLGYLLIHYFKFKNSSAASMEYA
jgi:putative peptidoglycan lipid II flippase